MAATAMTRNQSGVQGLSNGIGLALAMISGVFLEPSILPDASGMGVDARNPGILAAWSVAGIAVVVLRGSEWKPRQQR